MKPKPCPFHTAQSKNLQVLPYKYIYAVHCPICGANGPKSCEQDLALEMWNTRAGSEYQDEIEKRNMIAINELKAELKQLLESKHATS